MDPYFSFVNIKPHIDFGLKLLGADIMAIPGLYQFIQVTPRVLSINIISKASSSYYQNL